MPPTLAVSCLCRSTCNATPDGALPAPPLVVARKLLMALRRRARAHATLDKPQTTGKRSTFIIIRGARAKTWGGSGLYDCTRWATSLGSPVVCAPPRAAAATRALPDEAINVPPSIENCRKSFVAVTHTRKGGVIFAGTFGARWNCSTACTGTMVLSSAHGRMTANNAKWCLGTAESCACMHSGSPTWGNEALWRRVMRAS